MTINAYAVICRAITEGIDAGWRRAHKHVEAPGEALIKEQIHNSIMNEISEYFIFTVPGDTL